MPITHDIETGSRDVAVSTLSDHAVTVVIPAFDAASYIQRCLRSVLSQSLRDLHAIVVDDASTDRTAEAVREIANSDPRVSLISLQRNVGQGHARNVALDAARGRFVWFIDADDVFCNARFLEILCAAAEVDGADMVRGQKHAEAWMAPSGHAFFKRSDPSEAFFAKEIRNTDFVSAPYLLHTRHFYNFLYRRDFLNEHGIRFVNPQWEERPFLIAALLNARVISSLPVSGYDRALRLRSTSHRVKQLRDVDLVIRNIGQLVELFLARGAAEEANPLHHHYAFAISHMMGIFLHGFPMRTVRKHAQEPEATRLLEAISRVLRRSKLRGDRLVSDPLIIKRALSESGYYGAAFECLRAGETPLLMQILQEGPVRDRQMLDLADLRGDARFFGALNRYITHHQGRAPLRKPQIVRARALPQVIVHIGATKTGSTYLQHVLDLNRLELLKQGVWYPSYGIQRQSGRPHKTSGHSLFGRDAVQHRPGMRNRLFQTLARNIDIHTVVISSEAFFLSARAHRVCRYLDPLPMRVLVYLRRQDEWVESQYREFVAGGAVRRESRPPEQWLNDAEVRLWCSYDRVLSPWAEAAGAGNLIVRPFESSQLIGGSLLSDFCDATGIARDGLAEPPAEARNEAALNPRLVQAMRRYNSLPFPNAAAYLDFVQEVTKAFGVGDADRAESGGYVIHAADRRDVLRRCAESNARVAQFYLGRVDGALFLDKREPGESTGSALGEGEFDQLDALYRKHAAGAGSGAWLGPAPTWPASFASKLLSKR